MTGDFPHPSRAGHYGLVLDEELLLALTALATALVPGGDGYPSGGDAQVAAFIQDRASETDRALLERLCGRWPSRTVEEAEQALSAMEVEDPTAFQYLRELVYHGYYSSHRVLATLADRGHAYHGAPQPLGYRITEEMRVPSRERGSYISTEEARRATHR